jgi:hypothetical protein
LGGLCAVLVFGLTLLTVMPAAHAALHGHGDSADHSCAVTLYAQGVTAAAVAAILAAVAFRFLSKVFVWRDAVVEKPGYVLLPACGPPVV